MIQAAVIASPRKIVSTVTVVGSILVLLAGFGSLACLEIVNSVKSPIDSHSPLLSSAALEVLNSAS